MSSMTGEMGFSGGLKIKKIAAKKAPLSWRIRNALRFGYWHGWLASKLAKPIAEALGLMTGYGELRLRLHKASGEWIDYGVVGYRVVTDVGVAFLVDDWDNNGTDQTTMNFHGVGTGTTAEAAADTALVTESTTILNPNSTRATGTRAQPAANQYRTTGVLTFDGSGAITEHGVFSASPTGTGVLWDRTVFAAVNVASGDSLSSEYTCTINSGS